MDGRRACRAVFAIALSTTSACGGESGVQPPAVAGVTVTSPLGALWDVGANVQLAAAPRDARGNAVSTTVEWTSTNPSVVSVGANGLIDALTVGDATIRAQAGGITGTLAVKIVDADLPAIATTTSDPFVAGLVAGTSAAVRTDVQARLADCATGVTQGHLERIQECIAAARSEASSATDATDRVLLAVLVLFVDRIERLLNL